MFFLVQNYFLSNSSNKKIKQVDQLVEQLMKFLGLSRQMIFHWSPSCHGPNSQIYFCCNMPITKYCLGTFKTENGNSTNSVIQRLLEIGESLPVAFNECYSRTERLTGEWCIPQVFLFVFFTFSFQIIIRGQELLLCQWDSRGIFIYLKFYVVSVGLQLTSVQMLTMRGSTGIWVPFAPRQYVCQLF